MRLPSRPLLAALAIAAAACEVDNATANGGGDGTVLPGQAYALRIGAAGVEEIEQVFPYAGGAVVIGTFTGTVDFDPSGRTEFRTSAGGNDVFVARIDLNGALQWVTTLGGPGNDVGRGLFVTLDGRVALTGSAETGFQCVGGIVTGQHNGARDAYIATLGATGSCGDLFFVGGPGTDEGRSIAVDATGGIIVAGVFSGRADFDPTGAETIRTAAAGDPSDVFVGRWQIPGQPTWLSALQGRGTDDVAAMAVDITQGVVLAGTYSDTLDADPGSAVRRLAPVGGGSDVFVVALNALNGDHRWSDRFASPNADVVSRHALQVDLQREVWIGGRFSGSMSVGEFNTGTPIVSVGGEDGFLARVNSSGLPVGGFAIGGPGNDVVLDVSLADENDGLFVSGRFQDRVDFSRGLSSPVIVAVSPSNSGVGDLFLARYNKAGVLRWASRLRPSAVPPLTGTAFLTSVASGGFWVGGRFGGAMNIDPGTGFAVLTAEAQADAWIGRFTADSGAVVRR
ncbi:MAG: hypothetical protein SFW08_11100 [Gemmatimonadaceae bacterium]|nr:hypothetical protein [Gemmatimonadaceae bacterium]